MPTNRAAYLNAQNEKLQVAEAPLSEPEENQILIKTAAVGINPVDWKMQDYGFFIQKYPTILGCDVAGTVIKTGPGVEGFKPNDRVFAHTLNLGDGDLSTAPFQEYVKVKLPVVAKIPDNLTIEQAVVMPLAVDTAAAGLFQDSELGLTLPPSSSGKGKTLLVWGGSGAVGCAAIQLASQAGYEVITTASKHNHDLCKSLGAAQVFDYRSDSIAEDLTSALKGKDVVGGYDTISEETTIKTCCRVLGQSGGKKVLVTTLPGTDQHASEGVAVKPIFALTVASNGIGEKLWKWLPEALKSGAFKPQPEPMVVGNGLESVQGAMDKHKAGVSGKKVVVTF